MISSGMDTFSKINYDQIRKKIRETSNVTIFTVSTGRAFNEWVDARSGMSVGGQMRSLDYLQADNQMRTFAQMTGGRWYNPRFQAEFPDVFRDISNSVRNQYTISFKPTNQKLDGSYRKLKVQLTEPGTDKPLTIRDRKNKEVKYNIIYARWLHRPPASGVDKRLQSFANDASPNAVCAEYLRPARCSLCLPAAVCRRRARRLPSPVRAGCPSEWFRRG